MAYLERAYFGLQCFWGESAWAKLKGVVVTRVGYAGGKQPNPTYKNIKDHTEITEITFDPKVIEYSKLTNFFWKHHNPAERRKKQYQSAILYVNDAQKKVAEETLKTAKDKYGDIETYVEPLDKFYQAEDYHQKYWFRQKKNLFDELSLLDTQVAEGELATKLNAYCAGFQDFHDLERLQKEYGLKQSFVDHVKEYALSGGDPRNCHA
uniref:peptide-methionine (S)-S-oxide reductase n=1 Tax=Caenorhabditis tropicalis TaxID=1561998 RepID=A0A1I7T0Y7_9PELO